VSLNTSWIELNNALKALSEAWGETKSGWKDPVSRDFDEHHFEPLAAQVVATLRAMDRLTPVLEKARRECSDRGD
jgi:hypothetical protein